MSSLTSYRDGSLGVGPNMSAYQGGSLGSLNMQSYQSGSLGCGCGMKGLGEESTSVSVGMKLALGLGAIVAYFVLTQ